MRFLIPFITIALVTGCATKTRVETVEVSVPVPVPCVDSEKLPDEVPRAEEFVTKDSLPGEKVEVVLVERERLREADTKFRALIQGCIND